MTSMLQIAQSLQSTGQRLIDAGELQQLFNSIFSTAVVPATGNGSAAAAAPITAAINTILSASATNNGLLLPPGVVGKQAMVINSVNIPLSIYPYNSIDLIIPAGSATPAPSITQLPTSTAAYICIIQITNPNGAIVSYWKQVGMT